MIEMVGEEGFETFMPFEHFFNPLKLSLSTNFTRRASRNGFFANAIRRKNFHHCRFLKGLIFGLRPKEEANHVGFGKYYFKQSITIKKT